MQISAISLLAACFCAAHLSFAAPTRLVHARDLAGVPDTPKIVEDFEPLMLLEKSNPSDFLNHVNQVKRDLEDTVQPVTKFASSVSESIGKGASGNGIATEDATIAETVAGAGVTINDTPERLYQTLGNLVNNKGTLGSLSRTIGI
ncbi:hypothetical protein ABW20_dc0107768 [Dactylellina cionopaga]|nr:hypothetical protein ABW20_dc0107768 [Dactylellina cionopaga]